MGSLYSKLIYTKVVLLISTFNDKVADSVKCVRYNAYKLLKTQQSHKNVNIIWLTTQRMTYRYAAL